MAEKLTNFDESVLKAVGYGGNPATYVIRNMLSWTNDHWGCGFWPGLETPKVLRACRRLQKRGLITEAPTSYAVMKCWALAEDPAHTLDFRARAAIAAAIRAQGE